MATLSDILTLISDVLERQGAKPNNSTMILYINEALRKISGAVGPIDMSWTSAVAGGLTITANSIATPSNCIEPQRLDLDDVPLARVDKADMESWSDTWRTDTGDPTCWCATPTAILLDSDPDTYVDRFKLYGLGTIGQVSTDSSAALAYIPQGYELLPADYVIANLAPHVTDVVKYEAGGIALRTRDNNEQTAWELAKMRWESGFAELVEAYRRRGEAEFVTFDGEY